MLSVTSTAKSNGQLYLSFKTLSNLVKPAVLASLFHLLHFQAHQPGLFGIWECREEVALPCRHYSLNCFHRAVSMRALFCSGGHPYSLNLGEGGPDGRLE